MKIFEGSKAISISTAHGECWCDRFTILLATVVALAMTVAVMVIGSKAAATSGLGRISLCLTLRKVFRKASK